MIIATPSADNLKSKSDSINPVPHPSGGFLILSDRLIINAIDETYYVIHQLSIDDLPRAERFANHQNGIFSSVTVEGLSAA